MTDTPARSFIAELRRRNVFRVAIAYGVTAWLIAQVAELAATSFEAPGWVMKMIITVLLLGLPVALIVAWAYEMTPEGLRRDPVDVGGQVNQPATTSTLNRVITIGLVLAVTYFAYDKYIYDPGVPGAQDSASTHESPEQDSLALVHSVAVLPFENMSSDADNEYFADGLSEELLNLLVKIPELQVAARTSSFSFKGKDVTVSHIAQELNVSYVLEGSVRKSGDQIRITAQLINAKDGFHLWSETFDRTMDEIFAIQDEIAAEVAAALEVTLLGNARSEHEVHPDSYEAYLRGIHFLRQRGPDNTARAAEHLKEAVELDGQNAAAWRTLAFTTSEMISFGLMTREEGVPVVLNALERARTLAPEDAVGLASEGYVLKNLFWDWQGAKAAIERGYQLDPRSQVITGWRASLHSSLGELDDAVRVYQGAIATDPLSLSLYSALGLAYIKTHRYDEAIETFSEQLELSPNYHWAYSNMGLAWLLKGDAERALDATNRNPDNVFKAGTLPMVYHTLGRHDESDAAMQSLTTEFGNQVSAVFVARAYSWRGDIDEAFKWLEKAYQGREVSVAYMLGDNFLYPLRDDPRWIEFLEKVNLLEYWQAMPEEYGGPR